MVRRWLRLPHDTSNAAIHAPIPEGGLGLFSTIATSKKLKESRLLNVEGIGGGGDEDDGSIIRSPHVLQIMEPKLIKTFIDTSTRDLHKHLDTHGLRGIGTVRERMAAKGSRGPPRTRFPGGSTYSFGVRSNPSKTVTRRQNG